MDKGHGARPPEWGLSVEDAILDVQRSYLMAGSKLSLCVQFVS